MTSEWFIAWLTMAPAPVVSTPVCALSGMAMANRVVHTKRLIMARSGWGWMVTIP